MLSRHTKFAVLLLALSTSTPALAVSYTAAVLNPTGFLDSRAQSASGALQFGHGYSEGTGFLQHAILWNGASASAVDYHPTNLSLETSYGSAVSGVKKVGYGFGASTGTAIHALYWNGGPADVVDLHPPTFDYSYGAGVYSDGESVNVQVGYGGGSIATGDNEHALLWSGTVASVVDLHPISGYIASAAHDVYAASQVGYGITPQGDAHALLWSGTAASYVDLNPSGFTYSIANAVYGNTQVGSGYGPATNDNSRALLWTGTSASAVDLHPEDYLSSEALAVSSAGQVGSAFGELTGFNSHAMYWNGDAGSAVDLHSLVADLSPSYLSSIATGIADDGTIVGFVIDDMFQNYAVIWTPDMDSESGVDGDYNNDGTVDAADYVLWRKGGNLHNEVADEGTNSPADYTEWLHHFGNTTPGAASHTPVPEPSALALLTLALLTHPRRRARG